MDDVSHQEGPPGPGQGSSNGPRGESAREEDEGFVDGDNSPEENFEKDPAIQPPGPLTPASIEVEQTQSQGGGLSPPGSDDEQALSEENDSSSEGYDDEQDPRLTPATLAPLFGHNREVPDKKLNEEQRAALQLVVEERQSACILGPGGTGKSTLNKAIQAGFRDLNLIAHALAPTGIAALQVNGSTIHSTFRLSPQLNRGIKHYVKLPLPLRTALSAMDVLILDEISMVSSEMFELLNRILQAAYSNEKPFGGVQVVVLGDFGQLPPVMPFKYCLECGREREVVDPGIWSCQIHGRVYEDDQWAFRAPVWHEINFQPVWLTQNHRQRDQKFARITENVWNGRPFTTKERKLLLDHPCDVKNAVKLYCTNQDRERHNNLEFEKLKGTAHTYKCKDKFIQRHPELAALGRSSNGRTLPALYCHSYEEIVSLKKKMPVVLTHNLDTKHGLVNGAQGVIIGFWTYKESDLPRPRYHPDYYSPEDDDLEVDVMATNGGHWVSLRQDCIREYMELNEEQPLPIVRFNNGKDMVIWPDCSISERGFEGPPSLLIRTQIPLIPGWALTIHKAQGMTLERVIVNLKKVFAFGQIYVALSRAKSLNGLKVEELDCEARTFTMPDVVKRFLETNFNITVG